MSNNDTGHEAAIAPSSAHDSPKARARERALVGLWTAISVLGLYSLAWLLGGFDALCFGDSDDQCTVGRCSIASVIIEEVGVLLIAIFLGPCAHFLLKRKAQDEAEFFPFAASVVALLAVMLSMPIASLVLGSLNEFVYIGHWALADHLRLGDESGVALVVDTTALGSPMSRPQAEIAELKRRWTESPEMLAALGPPPPRLRELRIESAPLAFEPKDFNQSLRSILVGEQSSTRIPYRAQLEAVFGAIDDVAFSVAQELTTRALAASLDRAAATDLKASRRLGELPLTRYFIGREASGYCLFDGELTLDDANGRAIIEESYLLRYCHAGQYLYAFNRDKNAFDRRWHLEGVPNGATHAQKYGAGVHDVDAEILHAFKVALISDRASAKDVEMLRQLFPTTRLAPRVFAAMRRAIEQGPAAVE
ncbi:MAG: hypothetical protein H0U74_01995 [Bradymonadaceae bacterium]|nr:hypothetical protein [Lujinxingiaceae bacterium]